MLTLKYIQKASRLQQQLGELRPGYLHDNVSAIEGPSTHLGAAAPSGRKRVRGKHIVMKFATERNKRTGEVRMTRKK